MQVKITYEKTQYMTAEVDLKDEDVLEFINNGDEHDYKTIDEARAGDPNFDSIVEEFIENIPVDEEAYWTKVNNPGSSTYLTDISVVRE